MMSAKRHKQRCFQRLLSFAGTLFLAAVTCVCGFGQTLTGSVTGIISDPSGARVAGARVSIRDLSTNEIRATTADSSGSYGITSLTPGIYEVTAEVTGFQRATETNVQVTQGATARVDIQLSVGSATENVSVSADTMTVQTDSAEVRGQLDSHQLSSLPVPANRNYESALILIPGINPPANQHSVAANPGRGLAFQSNGSFGNTNNIRIDGATANNVWLPHVAAYNPGLDAIESVSVVTNSYDAQQGLAGGASINVHVKTGTNNFHGSGFWYHTDNVLTAKPFFLPAGFVRNPKDVDNFFGGTIGGPLKKDRLFFFFSYDGHYIRQIANVLTTVPTDAMRAGDFSGSSNPIYDPNTGTTTGAGKTAFTGNIIPAERQSPISLAIQSHIPHANLPGISNNYFATGPYRLNTSKYDANVTYKATSALTLDARLGVVDFSNYDAPAYGDNGVPVSSAGGRQGTSYGKVWNGTFSAVYVIKPTLVFDGYFGATVLPTFGEPVGVDQNVGLQLGIPGTNGPTSLYGGWPNFSISNFSTVGNSSTPLSYDDQEYQLQPNFTLTHGSHTVRFGVNVSRQIIRHGQPQNASAGNFTINGAGTTVAGGPGANAYNAYADFLLGRFSTGLAERLPYGELVGKTFIYSAFAQDQWIASKNVTLSYGLRWDYFPVGGRDGRGFARYDPTNNTVEICGLGYIPHDCGYHMSRKTFSPSAGIAVKVTDSMVLRAGAGLNRDPYPLAFMRDLVQNFPDDIQASIVSPNGTVASYTFAQGLPPVTPVDTSTGVVSLPNTYTINWLPDHPTRDYVESWNVSVENQWKDGFMTTVRYVGSRQLQISSVFNLNAGAVGGGTASEPFNIRFGRTAATNLITPVGRNQYDALQAQLVKRFHTDYSFQVGYTFSKTFAYCCDTTAGETVGIQVPSLVYLNRALAGFDRPYILTVSGTAQLPFGKNKTFLHSGLGSAVAGGWQLNGIFESYSGTPFTISSSGASLNAPGSSQFADRVRGGRCNFGGGWHGAGAPYVDATCFAPVTAVRFGTAGFNSVRGPGVNVLNGSVFRRFHVYEATNLEFRAEVFNVTNTPHFGNPSNTNISNVTFNPDHTVAKLNGFGQLTSVNSRDQEGIDQRNFRLGVRVEF